MTTLFESFDVDFVINESTTVQQLTQYLDEKIEDRSNYGENLTFENIVETLVMNSLMAKENMDEDKAGELSSNFVSKHFQSDYDTITDEYDEYGRRYEGSAKFDNVEVFTWSAAGDGYGYGGALKREDLMLKGIQNFLANWKIYE
jgi:hypothetical protein